MDLQQAFDEGFEAVKAYLDTELTAIRREFADQIAKSIPAPVVMKDVRDGIDGRDGIGVAGAVLGRDGDLVITLSNGDIKSLGQIVGKDGADGRDGKDVDMEAVMAHVETVARSYLEALPVPKDGKDGLDGKSVDLSEVAELVSKAVSEIPAPQNGVDGKDGIDGKDGVSVDMAEIERLIASEAQKAISDLPKPRDGVDGKSVTLEDVQPLIDDQISKAVAQIPVPKAGKDGLDGKSIAIEDVVPLISEEVSKAVSAIPTPENGKDGADADMEAVLKRAESIAREAVAKLPIPQDGKDGTSVTIDDVLPLVQKAFEAMPTPRDGTDGKSVTIDEIAPLVTSEVTKAVSALPAPKDGKDGSDGLGIAEALKDADGQLVLTMTDGTIKKVGSMIGPAGKDGFSLKDFDVEQIDDGRTLLFSFDDGHVKQSVEIDFPISIYRGIYQEGKEAKRGDCFTWAGSVWHCEETTTEKPGEGSKSWRLAVKRGRDGKDFAGPQTPPSGKVKL